VQSSLLSSSSSSSAARSGLAGRVADAAALAALEAEEASLQAKARRSQRDAEGVTDGMQEEVMALLELWGIPYIVAPMEAEAQCAELERLNLCEGVVTDDSDAFLFGATQVYKNIFESAKYVEVYKAGDVERELGLSRDDLVRAALLLGSDYTEGVRGVGIVNTVEILRAFPGDEGLRELKRWIDGLEGAKEEAKLARDVRKDPELLETMSPAQRFKLTHQGARKRWVMGDTFPNRLVLHAYRHPNVSHNTSRFKWTPPDFEGLAAFAVQKLQFSETQAASVLLPVAQELSRKHVQRGMDSYLMRYQDKERAGFVRSKRLKYAVEGLAGKDQADELAIRDEE
jgi:DNA excision repair protein ERCC-5